KLFDCVELLRFEWLKHSQAKRLRQRRTGTIKHRVRAGDFGPFRAPIGKRFQACFDKLSVRARFGSFEPPGQIEISKRIFHKSLVTFRWTGNSRHSPQSAINRMPRPSNWIPEPATRSFTVLDTNTSPACASFATQTPTSAAIPETLPSTISTSPVCSPARV